MKIILCFIALSLTQCSFMPKNTTIKSFHFSEVDPSLTADLYIPDSFKKPPVVVVVHGGGWSSRTGDMTKICKKLVKNGMAAFNITYRLAPEHLYPKALVDVKDAIDWLKRNGAEHNIDTNRIAGWGYSAGAHLILLAGLNPELNFKALVAGGTPAKLTAWPKSPIITKFIGHPMSTHEEVWKEASPIEHIKRDSPPVFMYHGALDILVEPKQMDLMSTALKEKKVEVQKYRAPYLGHLLVYLLSAKSDRLGIEFLKEKL